MTGRMRVKREAWLWIARHRHVRLVRWAARVSQAILTAYESQAAFQLDTDGETRVLDCLISDRPRVLLDVGANVGEWSLAAAARFPRAVIHSFEPVASTHAMLAAAVDHELDRVFPHHLALGEESATLAITVPHPGSPLSSISDDHGPGELVTVVRGDEWCAEQGIEHIDFLKIDTEGWDHHVLRGFERMLSEGRVDIVQFEYGKWAIESRFLLRDFYDTLEAHGKIVGKIYPAGVEFGPYDAKLEDFTGLNYIAVDRRLEEAVARLRGRT